MKNTKELILDFQPLKETQLTALRSGYNRNFMLNLGKKFLTQPYPPAVPWANFVMDHLYGDEILSADKRELILTALLVASKQPGTMAIHMYWALMEGNTPEELGHLITLVGTYTGIDNYTIGIRTFHSVMETLQGFAANEIWDSEFILKQLLQLFPA